MIKLFGLENFGRRAFRLFIDWRGVQPHQRTAYGYCKCDITQGQEGPAGRNSHGARIPIGSVESVATGTAPKRQGKVMLKDYGLLPIFVVLLLGEFESVYTPSLVRWC